MPKKGKVVPAAVAVTERMVNATVKGHGGPFTKRQQRAVEDMRVGVQQGLYERPRPVR